MSVLCPYPYEENYDGEGEYAGCWSEQKVRARKRHSCCECGATIEPGEVYGLGKDIQPGYGWVSWKRCPACLILAEMVATMTEECPLWGGLANSVEMCNDERRFAGKPEIMMPRTFREAWEEKGSAEERTDA